MATVFPLDEVHWYEYGRGQFILDLIDMSMEQRFDKLENKVDALCGTVDALSGTVDKLGIKVDTLAGTVDKLAETVDKGFSYMHERFEQMDGQFDAISHTLLDHTERLDRIEGTMATKDDIQQTNGMVEGLATQVKNFEQEQVAHTAWLQRLDARGV